MIVVLRINHVLSNEIYFLLQGSIIMLKSIFNMLGSIVRGVLLCLVFVSILE